MLISNNNPWVKYVYIWFNNVLSFFLLVLSKYSIINFNEGVELILSPIIKNIINVSGKSNTELVISLTIIPNSKKTKEMTFIANKDKFNILFLDVIVFILVKVSLKEIWLKQEINILYKLRDKT